MKIRNKKTGAEYVSSTLKLRNKGHVSDWHYCDEYNKELHWFYLEDGWEEVVDETDFVVKWHDLRKDPDDLPSTWRNVYIVVDIKACCGVVRIYRLGFYHKNARLWVETESGSILHEKVVAWREISKFNED